MTPILARTLFLSLLTWLSVCLLAEPIPGTETLAPPPAKALYIAAAKATPTGLLQTLAASMVKTPHWADPVRAEAHRVVFLAGNLSREDLVVLGSCLSASGHPGVLLVDSPGIRSYLPLFLQSFHPECVVPVGSFPEGSEELAKRLRAPVSPILKWETGPPRDIWRALLPGANRMVVSPAEPRMLLQAACLASVLQAPLHVVRGDKDDVHELRDLLHDCETREVFAVGSAAELCRDLENMRIECLAGESEVRSAYLKRLLEKGPIRNIVFANPIDFEHEVGCMSCLAPWIALHKRAPLLLTNDEGNDVPLLVEGALRQPGLEQTDTIIFAADLDAIPMERRPNPIAGGKDPFIEMEPLTPTGAEPYTFATGRLFHEDPGVVALMLARSRLLKAENHKALVASNSGGSLPLLETFSRNTAKELLNRGYDTTTLFARQVNKEELRRLLPEQDVFLWEGHHNTLIKDWDFPSWNEPLRPSFFFLQSCLVLKDYKAQPLLERGAVGVVGASTRVYSGSGGAFALSFFDALLYDNRSLGGSLRQAKNFLLTYALLKEKRLGRDARLTTANVRSAWAFSLWGDPTLRLPAPDTPEDALPPVCHQVQGNSIRLKLPVAAHEKEISSRYCAQMLPNGRLAGLMTRDEESQCLVPFVFAEVALPHAPTDKEPLLTSKIPSRNWVFCWDRRRNCGYLLVAPRTKDGDEIRFHIKWELPETSVVRSQESGVRSQD